MDQDNNTKGVLEGNRGISNNTIAVLVVLALLITIIGTWAVISNMNAETPTYSTGTNVGVMSLTILPHTDSKTTDNGSIASDLGNK
jgi:hypothetical protein